MFPSKEKIKLRSEAAAWVIRLNSSSVSLEDRRAFDAWQAQSPAHALIFCKVFAVWNSPDLHAAAAVVSPGHYHAVDIARQ